MGNNLAPPFAIIVMHYVESKVLSSSPYRPQMYKRYVDDVIMIWPSSRSSSEHSDSLPMRRLEPRATA